MGGKVYEEVRGLSDVTGTRAGRRKSTVDTKSR
jgi:hypothetical protein